MVASELQNYVSQSKKSGMSDQQIRQTLLNQGWAEADINQAVASTPTVVSPGGRNWKLIVGVLAGLIIIGSVAGYLLTKKSSPGNLTFQNNPSNNSNQVNKNFDVKEGKLGDNLSNSNIKIQVIDYGPVEHLDQIDYLPIKMVVENLSNERVLLYDNFKFSGTLDNYFTSCYRVLAEKYSHMLPVSLNPKQKVEGVLPCPATFDDNNILTSVNGTLEYNDRKLGKITIKVYSFADIKDQLASDGKLGTKVGTKLSWNDITINSYQVLDEVGNIKKYSSKEFSLYGSVGEKECGIDRAYHQLAKDKGITKSLSRTFCQLLAVNVTVTNKGHSTVSSNLKSYWLGIVDAADPQKYKFREYHVEGFNQLSNPLNLSDIKPGESRTGDLVFSITKYIDLTGGIEKNSMLQYSFGATLKAYFEK